MGAVRGEGGRRDILLIEYSHFNLLIGVAGSSPAQSSPDQILYQDFAKKKNRDKMLVKNYKK